MDDPVASSHRGDDLAADLRSPSASVSGRIVDIVGLPVLVRADDASRREAIFHLLGDLLDHPDAPVLTISFTADATPVPATAPTVTTWHLRIWIDAGERLLVDDLGASARVTRDKIEVQGRPELLGRVLPFALAPSFAAHGRLLLHGAAIVRNGRAVVALGESGAGKSSLVLAALDAGWSALGDDMVVVREQRGRFEVAAIPRPFRVASDVVADDRAGVRRIAQDARRRAAIDGHTWDRGWREVAAIVLVTHAAGVDGESRPIDPSEAFERILASVPGAVEATLLRETFPLAARLSRIPASELRHASDPTRRLAEAARLLADLAV